MELHLASEEAKNCQCSREEVKILMSRPLKFLAESSTVVFCLWSFQLFAQLCISHSSTILELLHFRLSKSLGIISKAQWVKTSAWVKWVNDLSEWSAGNAVAFNGSHQNNLSGPDRQDALGVDQAWVAQVVESTFAENLSSGLEPHCLAELDTVAG
ncbi:hypothetical protein RJ640_017235 [Escallonia rubra]|uniref:Uncharacterized protein n=1 Tax=Escallonia rubra TaxID=112253 RepID=A0AA88U3M2_9ASTE|nr:hypothetical protein RJ640_017235 [Escallonia rubra]